MHRIEANASEQREKHVWSQKIARQDYVNQFCKPTLTDLLKKVDDEPQLCDNYNET